MYFSVVGPPSVGYLRCRCARSAVGTAVDAEGIYVPGYISISISADVNTYGAVAALQLVTQG